MNESGQVLVVKDLPIDTFTVESAVDKGKRSSRAVRNFDFLRNSYFQGSLK